MKKNQQTLLSAFFIIGILCWIFLTMMPQTIGNDDKPLSEFSVKRALLQVSEMTKEPHYVGSENHKIVGDYLVSELKKLGLETKIEEGTTLSDWGNLVKSRNILARIKGSKNTKALMLLSHYDSAPHSFSHGAGDDATGVATILEGIRAFVQNATPHKNDIIILFSDAEELGLNGAAQFVTQSGWAKETGLVINFEARGTAGPSYMFMEVNEGNAKMVKGFSEANPRFPVANSLMYSIYKMLPNDTDLTVFRKEGKIQGFNFALIDDHFNYHTQQDDIAHLDHQSVAHQGSYLMPLLGYFANADLSNMTTSDDAVYFSSPLGFMSYPFSWILPMLIVAAVLFVFFVFIGIGKRTLIPTEIGKGFALLFGTLGIAGLLTFFGWRLLLTIYPQYKDILQGFTYNGHAYIFAFLFLSLAVSFLFYRKSVAENVTISRFVAPLFLWLLINAGVAFFLSGAAFFIIPVFCAVLMLAYFVLTQRTNTIFNLLFSIPVLFIFAPLVWMFPIGLGLKILFGSAILTVLIFTLLLPVFGAFSKKSIWSLSMFVIAIGFFIYAHINSGYEPGKAKPNSLVYVLDANKNKANWATYDINLDDWTKKYLGENPGSAAELNTIPLFSKYNTNFTYAKTADLVDLPQPEVIFLRDTIIGNQRHLKIRISPNRKVNRYGIFANENLTLHNFKANGAQDLSQKGSAYPRKGKKLLSYYVVDNEPLELQFSINKSAVLDMELLESSFDLLTNLLFDVDERKPDMMPTPFILNNAIMIRQKIKPTPKVVVPIAIAPVAAVTVRDTIQTDEPEIIPDVIPEN